MSLCASHNLSLCFLCCGSLCSMLVHVSPCCTVQSKRPSRFSHNLRLKNLQKQGLICSRSLLSRDETKTLKSGDTFSVVSATSWFHKVTHWTFNWADSWLISGYWSESCAWVCELISSRMEELRPNLQNMSDSHKTAVRLYRVQSHKKTCNGYICPHAWSVTQWVYMMRLTGL